MQSELDLKNIEIQKLKNLAISLKRDLNSYKQKASKSECNTAEVQTDIEDYAYTNINGVKDKNPEEYNAIKERVKILELENGRLNSQVLRLNSQMGQNEDNLEMLRIKDLEIENYEKIIKACNETNVAKDKEIDDHKHQINILTQTIVEKDNILENVNAKHRNCVKENKEMAKLIDNLEKEKITKSLQFTEINNQIDQLKKDHNAQNLLCESKIKDLHLELESCKLAHNAYKTKVQAMLSKPPLNNTAQLDSLRLNSNISDNNLNIIHENSYIDFKIKTLNNNNTSKVHHKSTQTNADTTLQSVTQYSNSSVNKNQYCNDIIHNNTLKSGHLGTQLINNLLHKSCQTDLQWESNGIKLDNKNITHQITNVSTTNALQNAVCVFIQSDDLLYLLQTIQNLFNKLLTILRHIQCKQTDLLRKYLDSQFRIMHHLTNTKINHGLVNDVKLSNNHFKQHSSTNNLLDIRTVKTATYGLNSPDSMDPDLLRNDSSNFDQDEIPSKTNSTVHKSYNKNQKRSRNKPFKHQPPKTNDISPIQSYYTLSHHSYFNNFADVTSTSSTIESTAPFPPNNVCKNGSRTNENCAEKFNGKNLKFETQSNILNRLLFTDKKSDDRTEMSSQHKNYYHFKPNPSSYNGSVAPTFTPVGDDDDNSNFSNSDHIITPNTQRRQLHSNGSNIPSIRSTNAYNSNTDPNNLGVFERCRIDQLTAQLGDSEAQVIRLLEQNTFLKREIRRLDQTLNSYLNLSNADDTIQENETLPKLKSSSPANDLNEKYSEIPNFARVPNDKQTYRDDTKDGYGKLLANKLNPSDDQLSENNEYKAKLEYLIYTLAKFFDPNTNSQLRASLVSVITGVCQLNAQTACTLAKFGAGNN